MRICFINPTVVLRRPVVELASLLAEEHQVSLMWPGDVNEKFYFYEKLKNVKLIRIPSIKIKSLRYNIPNPIVLLKESLRALRENDIVHIWEYYYPCSVLTLLARPFGRAKIILTTDGFVGYSYIPSFWLTGFFRLYTRTLGQILFKIPDKITLYGKPLLKYALNVHVPRKKIIILPTGIDSKLSGRIKRNKNGIKKEFGIKNEFVIVFIGMLTERKGVDHVINVTKRLMEEDYKIKTLIVGEGPLGSKYRNLAKKLNNIIFIGGRKDALDIIYASNVLLLPSMGEGLPGVVMEASVLGKPSVATDEGCTQGLVVNGKTGFLIRPHDEKGFFEAIKFLIEHKNIRECMGKNAQEHIKRFYWEKVLEGYKRLYSNLKQRE